MGDKKVFRINMDNAKVFSFNIQLSQDIWIHEAKVRLINTANASKLKNNIVKPEIISIIHYFHQTFSMGVYCDSS